MTTPTPDANADDGTRPPNPAELMQQLTAMAARLWGVPTVGAPPVLPVLPQVGAMSAQQVGAMVSTVRAQRQSIAALQSQLQAFDEHLASLEQLLEPLRAWTASWAAVERGLGGPARPTDQT
ncbi:hypothetical protein [Nakamurella deserti]|uniref:hypothetical protein n=1 Tax=Nakamurella deserti TaxID=2164074 RepID=UPI000DBE3084|nr:hypothetical protein [Nakamurella deserti]